MKAGDIERIARSAAGRVSPDLDVVGVTINTGGGTAYVEILLDISEPEAGSCQVLLGVFRDVPEPALEAQIASQLEPYAAEHRARRKRRQ